MILVGLSLFMKSAAARGVKRFLNNRGGIRITNPGGTDQDKETSAGDNQALVPRPTFQGPENKLEKMRALGILPPEEKQAESGEAPAGETKTTPAKLVFPCLRHLKSSYPQMPAQDLRRSNLQFLLAQG